MRGLMSFIVFVGFVVAASEISMAQSGRPATESEKKRLLQQLRSDQNSLNSVVEIAREFSGYALRNDIDGMLKLTRRKSIEDRGEKKVRKQYAELAPNVSDCVLNNHILADPLDMSEMKWEVNLDCQIDRESQGVLRLTLVRLARGEYRIMKAKFRTGAKMPVRDHHRYRRFVDADGKLSESTSSR